MPDIIDAIIELADSGKLSPESLFPVQRMARRLVDGDSTAMAFGITQTSIYEAVARRRWQKHIENAIQILDAGVWGSMEQKTGLSAGLRIGA